MLLVVNCIILIIFYFLQKHHLLKNYRHYQGTMNLNYLLHLLNLFQYFQLAIKFHKHL